MSPDPVAVRRRARAVVVVDETASNAGHLEVLFDRVPDDAVRHRILVDTPEPSTGSEPAPARRRRPPRGRKKSLAEK